MTGRPSIGEGGRVNAPVNMPEGAREFLQHIGGGSVSMGLRNAVKVLRFIAQNQIYLLDLVEEGDCPLVGEMLSAFEPDKRPVPDKITFSLSEEDAEILTAFGGNEKRSGGVRKVVSGVQFIHEHLDDLERVHDGAVEELVSMWFKAMLK